MIEKTLDITTKDGAMETFICHPERNGPLRWCRSFGQVPGRIS
jgi:hypothetical protein